MMVSPGAVRPPPNDANDGLIVVSLHMRELRMCCWHCCRFFCTVLRSIAIMYICFYALCVMSLSYRRILLSVKKY